MIEYESLILREAPIQLRPPSYERIDSDLNAALDFYGHLLFFMFGLGLGIIPYMVLLYG